MFHLYLHLDSIDAAVVTGASVAQGQVIGTVGDDDATYFHLHMEMRKSTVKQIGSVHPLGFLPYVDTANFSAPVVDRFNRLDAFMAARLLFGATSKRPGDLQRVEVELRRGRRLLTTRVVDFNDKTTVTEGKGDEHRFVGGIGVEGYQKSNMIEHGRSDLAYGILVRAIPQRCDTLVARVIGVRGHTATSAPIAVPTRAAIDEFVDFEDGQLPPAGWASTSASGAVPACPSTPPPPTRARWACCAPTSRSPRPARSGLASSTACRPVASSGGRRPGSIRESLTLAPGQIGVPPVLPKRR